MRSIWLLILVTHIIWSCFLDKHEIWPQVDFNQFCLLSIDKLFSHTLLFHRVFFISFTLNFSSFIIKCARHFFFCWKIYSLNFSYTPLYDRISSLSKAWLLDIISPALCMKFPLVCVPDVAVAQPTSTFAVFYYRSVTLAYWSAVW